MSSNSVERETKFFFFYIVLASVYTNSNIYFYAIFFTFPQESLRTNLKLALVVGNVFAALFV